MQIVEENKRQLCVYKQANETGKPWLWWDFTGAYATRCTFANGKFNDADCAKAEVEAIGLDNSKVMECMGDSKADEKHPLLQVRYPTQTSIHSPSTILPLAWHPCPSNYVLHLRTALMLANVDTMGQDLTAERRAICKCLSEQVPKRLCFQNIV